MKWWKAVIAGVLFLGAAAITAGGLRNRPPPTKEVQISKVRKGTITRTITGAGKVQAATTVKISSNLSGDLIDVGSDFYYRLRERRVPWRLLEKAEVAGILHHWGWL